MVVKSPPLMEKSPATAVGVVRVAAKTILTSPLGDSVRSKSPPRKSKVEADVVTSTSDSCTMIIPAVAWPTSPAHLQILVSESHFRI